MLLFVAAEVIKAIEESKDVQAFTLEGNTLGVEAAKAIGSALSKRHEFQVHIFTKIYGSGFYVTIQYIMNNI